MWTMDELVERVARALSAAYPGAPNGRVRDLPDRRAIRWYTTTGLVDRPLGMRGRNALYGRRHLLQLVAVKKRQALGLPLAAIQAELHGASDEILAEVADVPADILADVPAEVMAGPPGAVSAGEPGKAGDFPPAENVPSRPTAPAVRFWAKAPALGDPRADAADRSARSAAVPPVSPVPSTVEPPSRPVIGFAGPEKVGTESTAGAVRLADGVFLVLPALPDAADRAAIAGAARPLLDLLADRGLLTFDDGSPS